MNIYEGLYRSLKELMPSDMKITFNNIDENSENCSLYFKGSVSDALRDLKGNLINRKLKVVINYNIKETFAGFEYGEKIIEAFNSCHGVVYRDDETNERICTISNIKLLGNINYLGKNNLNALNCFSINFLITYGN